MSEITELMAELIDRYDDYEMSLTELEEKVLAMERYILMLEKEITELKKPTKETTKSCNCSDSVVKWYIYDTERGRYITR